MNLTMLDLPFRYFFSYLLIRHAISLGKIAASRIKKNGDPKRGTYRYPRFLPNAKKILREQINELIPTPFKELMLLVLRKLPAPGEIILHHEMMSANAKKNSKHIDIMMDPEIRNKILILTLLGEKPYHILEVIRSLAFTPTDNYCQEDIEKFQYYFWNTGSKYDWGYTQRMQLKNLLELNPEVLRSFQQVTKYGFGGVTPDQVMRALDIPMTKEMRIAEHDHAQDLLQYTLIDALKSDDLKSANVCSLIQSRTNKRIQSINNNSEQLKSEANDEMSTAILNRSITVGNIGGD